jgi:hypothetical protein
VHKPVGLIQVKRWRRTTFGTEQVFAVQRKSTWITMWVWFYSFCVGFLNAGKPVKSFPGLS